MTYTATQAEEMEYWMHVGFAQWIEYGSDDIRYSSTDEPPEGGGYPYFWKTAH